MYAQEAYRIANDDQLTDQARRELMLKYGKAMNAAMPHEEVAQVKALLDVEHKQIRGKKLHGKVASATRGRSRRLRSATPRE